jgi:hypothetical protein
MSDGEGNIAAVPLCELFGQIFACYLAQCLALPSAAPKSQFLGLFTRRLILGSYNSDLFRLSAIRRNAWIPAGLKSALVSCNRQ